MNEERVRAELAALAAEYRIEIVEVSSGHFHVKGRLLVNYYPFSKRKSAYVAGTTTSKSNCNAADAVQMAMTPPGPVPKMMQDKRRGSYRKVRERLLRKSDKCHWCEIKLTLDTSTLDHVIPLGLGGLDHPTNWVLACAPCNAKRGCSMPELEAEALSTIGSLVDERNALEDLIRDLRIEIDSLTEQRLENPSNSRTLRRLEIRKLTELQQCKVKLKRLNMQIASIENKLYQAKFSEVARQKLPEQLFEEIQLECARRYEKIMLPYKRPPETPNDGPSPETATVESPVVSEENSDAVPAASKAGDGCPF